MTNIDEIDNKLINLLEQDAWQTSEALAKALNISSATVRRRLKRLVRSGAIHAVAISSPGIIGARITTMIALNVSHENIDAVEARFEFSRRYAEAKAGSVWAA